nr:hypothetical protein [Azospirillum sp. SYSU D00513]
MPGPGVRHRAEFPKPPVLAVAPAIFKRFKIHFTRPLPGLRPGRPERDAMVERVKRFASENGMAGDLHSIAPSAAFGILEVLCTEKLARRLSDLSEVESVLEA